MTAEAHPMPDPDDLARYRIAANLRAHKARRKLRDADVAAGVGMSRSRVQTRMAGTTPCKVDELDRFARYFKTTPEKLLTERPEATGQYARFSPIRQALPQMVAA